MSRSVVTSAIEIASSVALVVGASLVAAAAGWIVAGLLGGVFAYRVERS